MKAGILIGHTPDETGAGNRPQQINEWHFNATLARAVAHRVASPVVIITRDRPNDWHGLPAKVNEAGPDFVVSMHANAYKGAAKGSETLYWPTSEEGKFFAESLVQNFVEVLKGPNRGARARREGRGSRLLKETAMPTVIAEPFFIDDELTKAQKHFCGLAEAYASAISEYRSQFS